MLAYRSMTNQNSSVEGLSITPPDAGDEHLS